MLRRRTRIFLSFSVFLMVVDIAFVALNRESAQQAMQDSLEQRGQAAMETFRVGMALTEDNMLQMATFVSHDPRTQALFHGGAMAVEREGGGAGGREAAEYRRALYQQVHESWAELTELFGFRQLHFHLPPGSTSFLRVHRPDKFGDTMHDLRHTVVAVNDQRDSVTGFETGRVYSGLRGVTPVFAPTEHGQVFVGALEAGISFQQLLERLQPRIAGEIAVLLHRDHVESSMWPGAIEDHFGTREARNGYYQEAATRDGLMPLVEQVQPAQGKLGTTTEILQETELGPLAITHAPLHDFQSEQAADDRPVGRIFIALDASSAIAEFRKTQRENITYALVTLIAFEFLLFFGIRHFARRLEGEIVDRTQEVRELNARLQDQATRDPLTGLANRRHFMEQLEAEISRSRRTGQLLAVAIADVDHFKAINDNHGHATGDEALRALAGVLTAHQRRSDLVARHGGEEFTVFMPETDLDGACTTMEGLRQRVAHTVVTGAESEPFRLSVSIGVAELRESDTADTLLQRADAALYRAKWSGRNRVVSED